MLTAFLDTWGIWAFVAGMTALIFFLAWANESHAPKPESDPAKVAAARAELEAQRIASPLVCTDRYEFTTCDRAAGHNGPHAHTFGNERRLTWENLADLGSDGAA